MFAFGMGAALDTVATVYEAVRADRFDDVGRMLAADIDWQGRADGPGRAPSCRTRREAVAVMRQGWAQSAGDVVVRDFREHGDSVLARVERRAPDHVECWFMLAEVRAGEITRLRAFATEAQSLAALRSDQTGQHESAAPLLQAVGISKRFGKKHVLDDLSLSASAGAAVAIVGENGSGKSTLLRICAGLITPDEGHVTASGRIGFCPQEPGLFDLLTAEEHLALFAPALDLSREQALDEGRRLLGELGFPPGEPAQVRHLSGGARQKLNLALALLGDARVLLLDEPYQGFDHGAYISFWEHVSRWKTEGRAIVVVTHLLADTTPVDRVVELSIDRPPSGGERR